jgi:surfactin family lipopeptide synthetase A
VSDPFSGEKKARLYKTGDLARFRTDGAIEYLGRIDDQIKLRGLRIELGEIEACLREAAECAEAAVRPFLAPSGATLLVGYYRSGTACDATELASRLARKLPEYMVPSAFMRVDHMPLTPNGKLNRKALPNPPIHERAAAHASVLEPPQGLHEQCIARCWRDILNVSDVGRNSSFFSLGGDSILGIRLIAVMRAAGYEITIADLFSHHRLADLATVARRPDEHPEAAGTTATDNGDLDSWPASQLQIGMIYHSRINPTIPVYHDIFRYRIDVPRVDKAMLVSAWKRLAEQHPTLRARFDTETWDEPRMVIERAPALPVEVVECPPGQDVIGQWVEHEKRTPIDPASCPAYRLRFFVTGPHQVVVGFAFHHAILDGWSVASVLEEWVNCYSDLLAGRDVVQSTAEATRTAQKRYAALEQRAVGDAAQAEFWRGLLGQAETFELPHLADVSGKRDTPMEVAVMGRPLEPQLIDALRQRARDWAVPLKSVFLAAHIRLLGFVGGRRDVMTGLVTNGRPETDGAERALGMFLNTLPFRVELNVNDSWKTLAETCFALEQRLQQHRWYPLAAIQRVVGSAAVSDVIFNFTHFHVHNRDTVVNEPKIVSVDYFEQTNVPLVVYVGWNAFPAGWEYRMGYNPSQFSAEQIGRYLDYYGRALAALACHGNGKWIDDMLLSGQERDTALAGPVQEARLDLGGHGNIRDRFEAMVIAHGDRIAVSCGERDWTYRELDRRANALVTHLAKCGVRPGDLVAIALERDLEMVLSIVAVIKAGAAYVPIDPANPGQRIATIVADSGARLLIGTESVLSLLPKHPYLSGTQAALDAIVGSGSDARPATELGAQSSAYVIFTSGSTGRPKGVRVDHGNVLRLFGATNAWFKFNEHDRWTLFHSFAFDFSVWEMWGALLHGGELVVVPYWASRSAEDFVDLVLTKKITVLNQTPSAFRNNQRELIRRCGPNSAGLPLRHVIFGGEALDFASLADWIAHFGDEKPRLVNMYGITETTVHVTYRPVRREDVASSRSLIGTPIPDLALYVLDEQLQPLPVGTVGELVIAGAGVAWGYVNAPDQSQQRFVEHDLTGSGRRARLYRSGDVARRLADGDIEYIGRADAQVKIHGYRIETGDIEAALVSHPAVASARVTAFKRSNGDMALAGYYVVKQERSVDVQALREHARATLPSYMVPSFFLRMESWPLTINGKTDLKALPHPETETADSPRSRATPRTAAEAEMARVWQQVLGTHEVGIDDTFYALGGDSIQGIRLVGALRRHGFDVALADLFQLQTIRKLFDHNVAPERGAAGQAAESLQGTARFGLLCAADRQRIPAGVVDAYPATQLQLGMVFHTKLDPAQATFHDLISYRIELPFDQLALAGLLEQMVRGHDVLRTSFALTGYSRPLQFVHENVTLALAVHDMSHLNKAYQEALIDQWFEAEKATAFQWNTAPLMRFYVHRLGAERFNFSVSFHHAIIDGWSFSRLMAGLLDNYHRATLGLAPEPAEQSTLAYRDYVRLELDAQHDEKARRYWMHRLQDAPYTRLPRIPEKDPYHRWSELSSCLDEGLHARLSRFATRRNVTVRQLCLAAHLRVLALITQLKDVTTGVFAHGRPEHVDADRMIGLFLNILPVRVPVSADWNELVADVQRIDHEQLPYRRYSYASIQRDLGGRRLVETGFNFVEFSSYRDRLGSGGAALISDIRWFEHADFALLTTFEVDPFTDQLRLFLNAAAHVLSQDALETVADIYRNVLCDLANTDEEYDAVESRSTGRPLEVLLADLPRVEDRTPDNYDRDGALPDRLARVRAPVDLTAVWNVFTEIYRERRGEAADGAAMLDFQPDSLEALRIVSTLRAQCGVNLPLRVLLGDNPIRATLRLLDSLSAGAARG